MQTTPKAEAVYDSYARAHNLKENEESRWEKWTADHGVDAFTMLTAYLHGAIICKACISAGTDFV
jgi:hypothetical protein